MAWSGPALVMWAVPLLLVVGLECAHGESEYSLGHLILVPMLFLALWLWVFWPSLSSLGIALVILSAVITGSSVFFIRISNE